MGSIRVPSAEGEVIWPRAAAAEALTVKGWIDGATDDAMRMKWPKRCAAARSWPSSQALHSLAASAEQCTTAAASGGKAA